MDGIAALIHNVLLVRDKCDEYVRRDFQGLRLVRELGANAPNWTKRDRRRLAFLAGELDGFQPPGRMEKYHDWLYPAYGESKLNAWYTAALATAVASDQVTLLNPGLSAVKQLAEQLVEEARGAASDGRDRDCLEDTRQRLDAEILDLERARRAVAMASKIPPADPPAADDPPAAQDNALELQDRALALLVRHPEWSDSKIAKTVGVSRTTLYKPSWLAYQRARETLRAGKQAMPRGSKDAETRSVEAWETDE